MEGSQNKPKRRLIFDRRYGWVYDEWRDPSEEALSGGRGLFCIAPLLKSFINKASNSIDAASRSVIQIIEKPELLSPQQVQANLGKELPTIGSFGLGFGSESNAGCSNSLGSESS